jgi:hypothetical protein
MRPSQPSPSLARVPFLSCLRRACMLLEGRVVELEGRLAAGDESAWPAYCDAVVALAAVEARLVPGGHGEFLTTKQMAERLQIAPKTLLKRKARGLRPALQLGRRGRAAIRWKGNEVAR